MEPSGNVPRGRLQWAGQRMLQVYREYVPNFAVLLLFTVSCISTFSGLWWLMQSVETLSNLVALMVSLALTGGIQLMLLYAISSWLRTQGARRFLFTAIYCFTVFFSVLFGYAFYFKHLRATNYGWEILEAETRRIAESAEEYLAQWLVLSHQLQDLSQHSARQSELEDTMGRTCGDGSPQGLGPRARGRSQDREIFAAFDSRFQQLMAVQRTDLDELRQTLSGSSPADLLRVQRALDEFHQKLGGRRHEAQRLWNDLAGYLQVRFPGGRYTIDDGVETYPCPDARLEQLAARALSEEFPDPPEAPQEFKAYDPKVVVMFALRRMIGLIDSGLSLTSSADRDRETSTGIGGQRMQWLTAVTGRTDLDDSLPLFLGVLVDVLIFLAAVSSFTGVARRRFRWENPLTEPFTRLSDEGHDIPHSIRHRLSKVMNCSPESVVFEAQELIRRFRQRSGPRFSPQEYLLVPVESGSVQDEAIPRLSFLAAVLESLELTRGSPVRRRWRELDDPLPPGLIEIQRRLGLSYPFEFVELLRLRPGVSKALVRELLK